MASPRQQLRNFVNKIEQRIQFASSDGTMRSVAEFARDTLVKRTRLGYGVDYGGGDKHPLKALSDKYVAFRRKSELYDLTSAKKSNLTFTGQLLNSIAVIFVGGGKAIIEPTGVRKENSNLTNKTLTMYLAEKGRIFLNISRLEANQIFRYWRQNFGDLKK